MNFKSAFAAAIAFIMIPFGDVISKENFSGISKDQNKNIKEMIDENVAVSVRDANQWLEVIDGQTKEAAKFAGFSPVFVALPLNYWSVLRRGNTICALRFTRFHYERSGMNLPPSESTYSFFANYDWVYQGDGSGDLSNSNVRSGHGLASKKPNLWRFERGDPFVDCGGLRIEWRYPNHMYLINRDNRIAYDPKISDQSNGVEFALTGWRNLADIRADDAGIEWRKYNPDGDLSRNLDVLTRIPVENLHGF